MHTDLEEIVTEEKGLTYIKNSSVINEEVKNEKNYTFNEVISNHQAIMADYWFKVVSWAAFDE